jgi:hypothetical protein
MFMNGSMKKIKKISVVTTTFFALSYTTAAFSAGLFDNILESVVEKASKDIISGINGSNQNDTNELPPTQPPKATKNTKTKPQKAKQVFTRPTKENHQQVTYKDWHATVDTVKDDGEWLTSCSVSTGGDGVSVISAQIPWGNMDPGTGPTVDYNEVTYRNLPTGLQGKQEISWVVSTSKGSYNYRGETYTGHDDTGHPFAINRIQGNIDNGDSLKMLRAFAKGSTVTLYDDYSGGDIHTASLSGFSASYRKVSQWCGFSPDSVLKVAPSQSAKVDTQTSSQTNTNISSTDASASSIPDRRRPRQERDLWQQYQDWQATVRTFETSGGDWVTDCSIYTGGDGDDVISLYISWDDALPPDFPLSISYDEAIAKGYATQLKGDEKVEWLVYSTNKRSRFASTHTSVGYNDGIPYASNSISGDEILTAFAQEGKVVVKSAHSKQELYSASLAGFSAAYQQMANWCAFPADNILN